MCRQLSIQLFQVVLLSGISFSTLAAEQDMDDIFAMTPAELASINISIASGTAKPSYQAAAVTSVITAKQIKSMGATALHQILETVPGLHVSIQAITNDPIYSMRGIRNEVNNQVLVMLNGVRYSVPYKGSSVTGMEMPVEAIQQIEIIRGPGSALYGADAFAGVINIITKKTDDIAGTEVGIRMGLWDTQSVWAMHGDHWMGWDVAATLQYSHNTNDKDRIIAADVQSVFDNVFGTNASLAPAEMQTKRQNWNAHLNVQRQYVDIDFWAFNVVDAGLRAGAGGSLDDEGSLNSEHYLSAVHFSTEDLFEEWQVLANINYLYTNIEGDLHNFPDGALLPIDANGFINTMTPLIVSLFPEGVLTQLGIENQVFAFEVSGIYKGFDDHFLRLSSGFRYEQTETRESRNFGKGVLNGTQAVVGADLTDVTGTDLVFLPNSHRSIWSVVIQDEWRFSQDWQLTTGLRYDHYSDFGSTLNPRVALVWEINKALSSKLLYGRAFRAPSFLEQKQQNSQLFLGTLDLEPETIDTVELAFDYRPYDEFRIGVNFYLYWIEDLIAANTSRNVTMVDNLKGQTGYGAELEWDWQLTEQFNLKGNYAWQYARNEEIKSRVTGVPEYQVYLAASWQFLPQWQLQTQVNWIGHRTDSGSSPTQDLRNYEVVDITLRSKRFLGYVDFSASVRNVFDASGKEPSTSYIENIPIASRSFYLQTSVHF